MTVRVSQSATSKILDALHRGLRVRDIVKETGFSPSYVYAALKRSGEDYKTRKPEVTNRRVVELYQSGLDAMEIADELDMHPTSIYDALKRIGIKLDRRGEAPFEPEPCTIGPLDEIWCAEFRGFFYGEGCAKIDMCCGHHRPSLSIGLRADDHAVLEDMQSKLGGHLASKSEHRRNPNASPELKWFVVGWSPCRYVIEAVSLASGKLGAKKQRDVDILYEAILARYKMPKRMSHDDLEILRQYRIRLQEVKRFQL